VLVLDEEEPPPPVPLVMGPEGGVPVSLGSLILRRETAALAALCVVRRQEGSSGSGQAAGRPVTPARRGRTFQPGHGGSLGPPRSQEAFMSVIVFIVIGLVAGLLARAIMPGRQSMGLIATTLLGMVGALVGGFIGSAVLGRGTDLARLDAGSLILSVLGAILVLFLYGLATGRSRRVTV
jgi:uncharacterized membrane protein YeaQ/YmgE (transglycosylase-associated protein family)